MEVLSSQQLVTRINTFGVRHGYIGNARDPTPPSPWSRWWIYGVSSSYLSGTCLVPPMWITIHMGGTRQVPDRYQTDTSLARERYTIAVASQHGHSEKPLRNVKHRKDRNERRTNLRFVFRWRRILAVAMQFFSGSTRALACSDRRPRRSESGTSHETVSRGAPSCFPRGRGKPHAWARALPAPNCIATAQWFVFRPI